MDWPQWFILVGAGVTVLGQLMLNENRGNAFGSVIGVTVNLWVLWIGGFFNQ